MEEDELVTDLRNRFKLSAVSLAEAEGLISMHPFSSPFVLVRPVGRIHHLSFHLIAAKRNDMEMSEPVSECIADLTLRYAGKRVDASLVSKS